jgi:hypothetical protein
VIGLVEHGHIDVGQRAGLAVEQVNQPAGRSDHDIDAAVQPVYLAPDGDPAIDGGDQQAQAPRERPEHVGDLLGKLSGRDQDEPARRFRPGPTGDSRDPAEHRQAEGKGLARPGLRTAEHVPPGYGVRHSASLDRERGGDLVSRQGLYEPRIKAECTEVCHRWFWLRGRGCECKIKF